MKMEKKKVISLIILFIICLFTTFIISYNAFAGDVQKEAKKKLLIMKCTDDDDRTWCEKYDYDRRGNLIKSSGYCDENTGKCSVVHKSKYNRKNQEIIEYYGCDGKGKRCAGL